MQILLRDTHIIAAIKAPGVLSTDEEGGMPSLLRRELGGEVYTVHRLDRVTGGIMVFARSRGSAAALSRQVRGGGFDKRYLAVIHWRPPGESGRFTDLLLRDRQARKTLVVKQRQKGAQEAVLDYSLLDFRDGLSLVRISPLTGRTHQIRVQFASRGLPLAGDKKYSRWPDSCGLALWACELSFTHPETGKKLELSAPPPEGYPWDLFL